jgi:hypothetical protein
LPQHRRFHARTTGGSRASRTRAITRDSCLTTEGPTKGSVSDDTVVMEWDGWRAKELSGFGIGRKPGATIEFQDLDGQVDVTLVDGKPTGWTATGHSLVTGAPERQDDFMDGKRRRSKRLRDGLYVEIGSNGGASLSDWRGAVANLRNNCFTKNGSRAIPFSIEGSDLRELRGKGKMGSEGFGAQPLTRVQKEADFFYSNRP